MYRGWTQTDYQNKQKNINQKWLQHIQRMDTNRLPKQTLQYKPKVATTCTEDGHKQTTKTNKKYKPKVATTCTEDGHKQTNKTSTII